MGDRIRPLPALALLIGAGVAALTSGAALRPETEASAPLCWHALSFRIRKLFFTVDTDLDWQALPSQAVVRELVPAREGEPLMPGGPQVVKLRLRIRHFLGRLTRTLWFDPQTGRPLQVREESDGDTVRLWRYLDNGVLRVRTRLRPEDGAPLDVARRFTPIPPREVASVIEADSLLFLLPASGLSAPGDRARYVIRVKGRPVTVEARVEAVLPGTSGCCGKAFEDAPERRFLRISLASADSDRPLRAIGLRGPLEVYLDSRTRAPVRVQGRVKWVGLVQARLTSALP